KANPDKATGGTSGAGSSGHLASILFQNQTGTRFQIVPYRGAAPAMQDLVSGQIDLRFASEGSQALPFLRDGQIKALAMLAPTRWPPTPDIPTIDEAGLPGIHLALWNGIWAPKATPRDIIDRLNAAIGAALSDNALSQRIIDLGQILPTPEQRTPEALAAYHKAEIEKWWPIIKAANIKGEWAGSLAPPARQGADPCNFAADISPASPRVPPCCPLFHASRARRLTRPGRCG